MQVDVCNIHGTTLYDWPLYCSSFLSKTYFDEIMLDIRYFPTLLKSDNVDYALKNRHKLWRLVGKRDGRGLGRVI